jgi:hypothetical protein
MFSFVLLLFNHRVMRSGPTEAAIDPSLFGSCLIWFLVLFVDDFRSFNDTTVE